MNASKWERKVHGSWKCGTEGDGDGNEQIGHYRKQENEQKDNEEYFLQVWILCESQENKLSHIVLKHKKIHSASNNFLEPELPKK